MTITSAFDEFRKVVVNLEKIRPHRYFTDPEPILLASRVLNSAQLPSHFDLGRRFIEYYLPLIEINLVNKKFFLQELCKTGGLASKKARAMCQDVHALKCTFELLGLSGIDDSYRRSNRSCSDHFNSWHSAEMRPGVIWRGSWGITRQLPFVLHRPWWNASQVPWVSLLEAVRNQFSAIREEALASLTAGARSAKLWSETPHGLSFGSNTDWDLMRSWDSITLLWQGVSLFISTPPPPHILCISH